MGFISEAAVFRFAGLVTVVFLIFLAILKKFVVSARSEEHTSELQSRRNLVCRLLLEKNMLYKLSYAETTNFFDIARNMKNTTVIKPANQKKAASLMKPNQN